MAAGGLQLTLGKSVHHIRGRRHYTRLYQAEKRIPVPVEDRGWIDILDQLLAFDHARSFELLSFWAEFHAPGIAAGKAIPHRPLLKSEIPRSRPHTPVGEITLSRSGRVNPANNIYLGRLSC